MRCSKQPFIRSPRRRVRATAADNNSFFDAKVIPSVAYTDPEVAWVGLTEKEAKGAWHQIREGVFPRAASGRSLSLGRDEGITRVLFRIPTGLSVAAVVGPPNAGDLIAKAALAIEMGADAEDIGLTTIRYRSLRNENRSMSAMLRKRRQTAKMSSVVMGHVWTAPGWQELSSRVQQWVGAAMCSAC